MSFSNQKIGFSSFFVQAGLVFLPVVLLAGIGLWLLAQDRDMAHREAVQIAEFQNHDLDLAAPLYDQTTQAAVEVPLQCLSLYGARCA